MANAINNDISVRQTSGDNLSLGSNESLSANRDKNVVLTELVRELNSLFEKVGKMAALRGGDIYEQALTVLTSTINRVKESERQAQNTTLSSLSVKVGGEKVGFFKGMVNAQKIASQNEVETTSEKNNARSLG